MKKEAKPGEPSSMQSRLKRYRRNNLSRKGGLATTIVYYVLTAVVIFALVRQAIIGNYENCFTCALTLVLFLIPNFIETKLKITLPQTLEVIIIMFIFGAEILGELNAFYIKFPWWDDMLHTMNGFLMAAVGFSMVDILNKNDRFKFNLSPLFIAVVSFCFSMTIGVLWEFFEFSADRILMMDMQKDTVVNSVYSVLLNADGANSAVKISGIEDMRLIGQNLTVNGAPVSGEYSAGIGGFLDIGLYDTMNDLFVNFIGAVVFAVFGFFYVKNRGKGHTFIERFIPRRLRSSDDSE
ncbi:MAG: hypothetical protein ACI4DY_10960 [Monoglobaceae bacterium]